MSEPDRAISWGKFIHETSKIKPDCPKACGTNMEKSWLLFSCFLGVNRFKKGQDQPQVQPVTDNYNIHCIISRKCCLFFFISPVVIIDKRWQHLLWLTFQSEAIMFSFICSVFQEIVIAFIHIRLSRGGLILLMTE